MTTNLLFHDLNVIHKNIYCLFHIDIYNMNVKIINQQYIRLILPLCKRYKQSKLYHKYNCEFLGNAFP